MTVPRFQLAPALESEHNGIVRFPVFGDGRVELRQTLQARQLVEHEPHWPRARLATIHQPQHEDVEPQTREWHDARSRLGCAREKQPTTTVAGPGRGTP